MPVQFFVSPDMADDRELNGDADDHALLYVLPGRRRETTGRAGGGRRRRTKACRTTAAGRAGRAADGWDRTIMAEAHAKHHDYHLVDPSPWPIIGAVSAFVLALALIFAMHGQISYWWLTPGMLGVLYTMFALVGGRDQGGASRRPYARRAAPPPLRHDHVHRLGGDVLRRLVLGLLRRQPLLPARRRSMRASRRPAGTGRRRASRCSTRGTCRSSTR